MDMNKTFTAVPNRQASFFAKGQSIRFEEDQWFSAFESLRKKYSHHVLLESGRHGKQSIIGLSPFAMIKSKGEQVTIETNDENVEEVKGDPLEVIREWLSDFHTVSDAHLPDFQGGVIGYISYDYVRHIEWLPQTAEDDLHMPDLCFFAFRHVYVFDHDDQKLWSIYLAESDKGDQADQSIEEGLNLWKKAATREGDQPDVSLLQSKESHSSQFVPSRPSFQPEKFEEAVRKVQDYIEAGDVFQVNLSVRQARPLHSDPFSIYKTLRTLNPSPYMAYIHTPEWQIVSGSPELLVKKRGTEASTRPIAGTRSRGKTKAEDEALEKELLSTEKERAEHLMLVDLERNDLGKVCRFGSVHVDEFMVIERYSHVMHIVSNVKGTLAEKVDAYDMIKATFPGGTITGAPKIRTMEIIEELEPVRRGIYTGSIGWIGFNGDTEMNIVIRTLLALDGWAYVQAGAGIVIDSDPEAEYKESLKKARALWKAKELSEGESMVKS